MNRIYFLVFFTIVSLQAREDFLNLTKLGPFYFYLPSGKELKQYSNDYGVRIKRFWTDQTNPSVVVSPWVAYHAMKNISSKTHKVLIFGDQAPALERKAIENLPFGVELNIVCTNQNVSEREANLSSKYILRHAPCASFYQRKKFYDLILITTPLTNLRPEQLFELLDLCASLLKSGGKLVCLFPIGVLPIRFLAQTSVVGFLEIINKTIAYVDEELLLRCTTDLEDTKKLLSFFYTWHFENFIECNSEFIFLNTPPLYVISLQKK